METNNTADEQQSLRGFFIIDCSTPTAAAAATQGLGSHNSNGRPFHLEKRFQQKLNLSESNDKISSVKRVQAAEQKRNALLEQKKGDLSRNYFLKVKKIAKEAKANRDHKIYILSKPLESAEFNRNQYIEQKRAKSKKIVERAKHVALQNQRRSEQEQERRKAELERRLKKTEERRLAHLSNRYKKKQPAQKSKRRTSSASSSAFSSRPSTTTTTTVTSPQIHTESMKVTNISSTCSAMMMTAAKNKRSSITPPTTATAAAEAGAGAASPKQLPTIVPKKKPSNWSIILKAFRELDLPSSTAPPQTWPNFDELGKLLKQPKVIVITTKVLNTALKITDDNSRFRARRLLTSYMMLMCPEGILGDINKPDEKRVHESAKEMLRLFEIWLRAHGHPGATAARLAFVDAYNGYCSVFESWKSKDYTEFIQFMIKDYVQQSTLRQTILASGDQLSSIETLDENLEKRKKQIEQFAGKEGLEQLQRALEAALGSTSTGRKKQQELRTPRTPDLEDDYFSNHQQQQQQHQQETDAANREHMDQLLNQYVAPAGNSEPNGLTNAQLAHELIMDPDFKLQNLSSEAADGLQKRIKDIAQTAFFDKMAADIEEGQGHAVIPPLLSDIKHRLMALSNPGAPIYNNIVESFDITLIEQQLKQHAQQFDMQKVIDHIFDLMTWMCAPIRDEEIRNARNLRSSTDINDSKGSTNIMLNQIRKIFSILDDMALDHANYKLQLLRPHLMPIAVDYERERFAIWLDQQRSSSGSSPLAKTQTWLTKSADKLCQEAAQRNPEGIQPQKNNKPSHDAILEEAFLSLLCQNSLISQSNVPETLLMDITRLGSFQNEIQAISIVGALVMIAKMFGTNINDNSMLELASRLFTMLEDNSTIDHLSAELTLAAHVRPEQREMLKKMVDKTLNQRDTVFTLILNRVAKMIKSTIHDRKFVSSAVLESNGLQFVQSQLQATALKVQRLVNHNKKVYAQWYDELIIKAINNNLGLVDEQ